MKVQRGPSEDTMENEAQFTAAMQVCGGKKRLLYLSGEESPAGTFDDVWLQNNNLKIVLLKSVKLNYLKLAHF